MNILYGVQATGNGHISRSREVVGRLKAMGHTVRVVLSGRDPDRLWDMDAFEPFTVLKGLTFVTERGKVRYVKTACQLDLVRFYRDIREFSTAGLDVVVTDFEPLTARVARRNGIPSIGLGHQYAFCFDIPTAGANPVARFVMKNYAPVDYPLGLHWHHFGQPILPPIVPRFDSAQRPVSDGKVLVYLPFENLNDVLAACRPLSTCDFFVYHDLDRPRDEGRIHLRPYSRRGFLEDLQSCAAVVSNAGFELISEALQLGGKKLVLKPLAGQMEQLSNALALSKLELGSVIDELSADTLDAALRGTVPAQVRYPDVAEMAAGWIAGGKWDTTEALCRRAWDRTVAGAG